MQGVTAGPAPAATRRRASWAAWSGCGRALLGGRALLVLVDRELALLIKALVCESRRMRISSKTGLGWQSAAAARLHPQPGRGNARTAFRHLLCRSRRAGAGAGRAVPAQPAQVPGAGRQAAQGHPAGGRPGHRQDAAGCAPELHQDPRARAALQARLHAEGDLGRGKARLGAAPGAGPAGCAHALSCAFKAGLGGLGAVWAAGARAALRGRCPGYPGSGL